MRFSLVSALPCIAPIYGDDGENPFQCFISFYDFIWESTRRSRDGTAIGEERCRFVALLPACRRLAPGHVFENRFRWTVRWNLSRFVKHHPQLTFSADPIVKLLEKTRAFDNRVPMKTPRRWRRKNPKSHRHLRENEQHQINFHLPRNRERRASWDAENTRPQTQTAETVEQEPPELKRQIKAIHYQINSNLKIPRRCDLAPRPFECFRCLLQQGANWCIREESLDKHHETFNTFLILVLVFSSCVFTVKVRKRKKKCLNI